MTTSQPLVPVSGRPLQMELTPEVEAGSAYDFARIRLTQAGLVVDLCIYRMPPVKADSPTNEQVRAVSRLRITADQAVELASALTRGAEGWTAIHAID